MIIFETNRLLIRSYTIDDLPDFYRLNGDEEVVRYIRPAQTLKQSKEFLQRILEDYLEQPGLGRWAMLLKNDKSFIGSFAVIPVQHSNDIQLGYALLKENWGKGYASESVLGGIDYAFGRLKLNSIAGITEVGNTASQKVLLKCGFVFEKAFTEAGKELFFYRVTKQGENYR